MIEQLIADINCPSCGARAEIKDRPVVTYVDLPVYGAPCRARFATFSIVHSDTFPD